MIVFDIETGPLPIDQIRPMIPEFKMEIGPFDPSSVKVGNLKDQAKINAKISEAAAAHEAMLASIPEKRAAHEAEFISRAALSPLTGQVLAVGFLDEDEKSTLYVQDSEGVTERDVIVNTWMALEDEGPLVGHNIFGFDLPFLIRRSWILDIDVPSHLRKGRYWSSSFHDTMDVWGCGGRDFIKLDDLAKGFGVAGKMEGVTGGEFAGLLESDREKALEYLRQDLKATWSVAVKLQIAY